MNRTDASTPARLPTIEPLNLWQARKSMTSSTHTPRRRFLSTAAALAASAAVVIPANAANALGADPILEAIEAHKAARLDFENAFGRSCALEQELPREKPGPGSRFGKKRLWK